MVGNGRIDPVGHSAAELLHDLSAGGRPPGREAMHEGNVRVRLRGADGLHVGGERNGERDRRQLNGTGHG